MDGWIDGWMGGWMNGWMDKCMEAEQRDGEGQEASARINNFGTIG